MRTTLTLEPDVAAMLKKEMRQQKATLKETINKALRAGLQAGTSPQPAQEPYRIKPWNTGPFLINIDCIADALAIADREDSE